ncbi:extracellular solute-binding protein [Salinicola sp. 4072]|uniref:extracellular solute-binding protein n=1 Tax=Salinicola sp. 4072 TaxID=3082157 RepID=UPI002FC83CE0
MSKHTKTAAAVAFCSLLLGTGAQAAEEKLYLFNWTEYMDPEIITAFEQKYDVEVVQNYYNSLPEMFAKLNAGGASQYDIIVPSNYYVPRLIETGLVQKLDHAKIPNLANVKEQFQDPSFDPGSAYSAPYQWGTTGMIYNTDTFPDAPNSWSLMFDPEVNPDYPFAIMGDGQVAIGAACGALGKPYDCDTLDSWREAAKLMIETKSRDNFSGFTDGTPALQQLARACYLGFTGTPLLKKEKNTLQTFGRLIHRYGIDEAVADESVVPLLYEGRLVEQQVSGQVIDRWFDKISVGLSEDQRRDLKRKFSRMDALNKTEQAIRAKAFDISEHYRQHWQGTGFKAQLVAPSKAAAVRFKAVLDEIGHVSSAIVISPPDDNEGHEEIDQDARDLVRDFWAKMMAQYKTEEAYNREIVEAFKGSGDPEILIVVSKLLTGFDAPRNTVLYVCKSLKEHNLLQAIARVNRLFEEGYTEKQFGFVIDYEGLLGELDSALTTYNAFEGYEAADLTGTVHDVREEIRKLPQRHDQLWDLFKPVRNKRDMEQFERHLADEARRQDF